ncbi:hypothetical protein OAO87_00355 [bacterium]|nr:hypothetical protein [bacterium]
MLVKGYSYNDIKRLIRTIDDSDEEGIEANSEDPLAERLVEGIAALPNSERDAAGELEISPSASVGALFQPIPEARELRPRLWIGFDLSNDDAPVCAMLTACDFTTDKALSTARFTSQYLTTHSLPRFDAQWTLIDVVSASKKGAGGLLALHAYLAATRAHRKGVCSIAVTKAGKRLFDTLGFDCSHSWREKGSVRYLCHASALHMEDIHAKLKVADPLLQQICWREGLTERSRASLVGRC